jgi:hypothetical protein
LPQVATELIGHGLPVPIGDKVAKQQGAMALEHKAIESLRRWCG